jgi:redox-sensitive bicupin YhaK (pirin superfamily)
MITILADPSISRLLTTVVDMYVEYLGQTSNWGLTAESQSRCSCEVKSTYRDQEVQIHVRTRKVDGSWMSRATIEGAGVRLRRALGPGEVLSADPFLLLDDFHSSNPQDYLAGFPWHPHRGIETVTYMIRGVVEHGDSIGNKGAIDSGDVQWMTAGSGILHQEMPQRYQGMMQGFQLWINLPSKQKMINPRYREVKKKQIPSVSLQKGVDVKVVSGSVEGTEGPVRDLIVETEYIDVSVGPNKEFEHRVPLGHTAFAYVFEGDGAFGREKAKLYGAQELVLFSKGDEVYSRGGKNGVRFLFISGRPLREPVAWGGPIVMNSDEELDRAFRELQDGTFIKMK